jgi:hypothetical protein
MSEITDRLHAMKSSAVDTLNDVLTMADSEDVRRKAAVDILNFSEKTKDESPVTEEQLAWLGKVLIEAVEIHRSLEISEK